MIRMTKATSFTATVPRVLVPRNACDCHTHVFGPAGKPHLSPDRSYTPEDALPEDLETMLTTLGIDRVVLVQPSVYGFDNTCLLDGIRKLGPRARGVVAVPSDIAVNELEALHAHGVRGARVNIASGQDRSSDSIASEMKDLANRISPLGWHLQLFVRPHVLPDLQPIIESLGVDVVIDHMGLVPADNYRDNPGFAALMSMLATGHVWVKASGAYRVASEEGPQGDLTLMARMLIDSRPDRIVWGSDWPHTPAHGQYGTKPDVARPFRKIDTGRLLDLLTEWAPDKETRNRILVENPALLYDFP